MEFYTPTDTTTETVDFAFRHGWSCGSQEVQLVHCGPNSGNHGCSNGDHSPGPCSAADHRAGFIGSTADSMHLSPPCGTEGAPIDWLGGPETAMPPPPHVPTTPEASFLPVPVGLADPSPPHADPILVARPVDTNPTNTHTHIMGRGLVTLRKLLSYYGIA